MHDAHDGILTLLQIPDVTERLLALKSRQVQPFHLRHALMDSEDSVRRAAVLHPNMTKELLTEVLSGEDKDLRHAALSRPDIDEEHLEQMGVQPEHALEVAQHPRCHVALRQRLLEHDIPAGVKAVHQAAIDHVQHIDFPEMGVIGEHTNPQLGYQWHPKQPHPHDDEMWYENPYEELGKSKKDALKMYKPEDPGHATAKQHVDWAYQHAPNENWALWTVRNHRKAPEEWTPEVKQNFEKTCSVVHNEPLANEVGNIRFDKNHSVMEGLNLLNDATKQYEERTKSRMRLAGKPPNAKKLVDLGNNWAWWDLGQSHCRDEGQAMGHCGNSAAAISTDTVLSLRKEHTIVGTKYWEPHATFIKNGSILGEMKGRGNKKPEKQYNPEIIKLLNSQGLFPYGGEGHAPENNFNLRDLTPEQLATVREDIRGAADGQIEHMERFAKDETDGSGKPKRPHIARYANSPEFDSKWKGLDDTAKRRWMGHHSRPLEFLSDRQETGSLFNEQLDTSIGEIIAHKQRNGGIGPKSRHAKDLDNVVGNMSSEQRQVLGSKFASMNPSDLAAFGDSDAFISVFADPKLSTLRREFTRKGIVPDGISAFGLNKMEPNWVHDLTSPEAVEYNTSHGKPAAVKFGNVLSRLLIDSKQDSFGQNNEQRIPPEHFEHLVKALAPHAPGAAVALTEFGDTSPELVDHILNGAPDDKQRLAYLHRISVSTGTYPDATVHHVMKLAMEQPQALDNVLTSLYSHKRGLRLTPELEQSLIAKATEASKDAKSSSIVPYLAEEKGVQLSDEGRATLFKTSLSTPMRDAQGWFDWPHLYGHLIPWLTNSNLTPEMAQAVFQKIESAPPEEVNQAYNVLSTTKIKPNDLPPDTRKVFHGVLYGPHGTPLANQLIKHPPDMDRWFNSTEEQREFVAKFGTKMKFASMPHLSDEAQEDLVRVNNFGPMDVLAGMYSQDTYHSNRIKKLSPNLQQQLVTGLPQEDWLQDRAHLQLSKLENITPEVANVVLQNESGFMKGSVRDMAANAASPEVQAKVFDHINTQASGGSTNPAARSPIGEYHALLRNPNLDPDLQYKVIEAALAGGSNPRTIKSDLRTLVAHYNIKLTPEAKKLIEDEVAKNIGFVTYPKLGEPTPYTKPMNETKAQSRQRAGAASIEPVGNAGWISGTYNDDPEKGILPFNQLMTGSAIIRPTGAASPQTSARVRGMGVTDPMDVYQTASKIDQGKRLNYIDHHEAQHSIFHRIGQKFGEMNQRRVVATTLSKLSEEHRNHIQSLYDVAGVSVGDITNDPEEAIAYLHNYLMDPNYRNTIHRKMGLQPAQQRQSQDTARKAWNHLRRIAAAMTPEDIGIDLNSYQNKVERWLKTLSKRESILSDHLGFSVSFHELIAIAQFLTGLNIDLAEVRAALRSADGDPKLGVLIAYGLNTPEGKKAFDSVGQMRLHKSEDVLKTPRSIEGMSPGSEEAVEHLKRAYKTNSVEPVSLNGKHSGGAYIAKLDHKLYLLKPGSGKKSPAAGVDETKASQSRREAAFSGLAGLLGIKEVKPAHLLLVDGKEVACMEMWPQDWVNLHRTMGEEPNLPRTACEPYRRSGELFKWSVLDFISGQPDRHGNNIMVGSSDEGNKLGLIDHGSAFAGAGFDPGHDTDSFVPYYLRVWAGADFHGLPENEQIAQMPTVSGEADQNLRKWIMGIDSDAISRLLLSYGIDPVYVLARLDEAKEMVHEDESASRATNKLWLASPLTS